MNVIVDTDVVLSAFTDRDARQTARAEALFRSAAEREGRVAIPQCVMFEAAFIVRNIYQQSDDTIASWLRDLVATPGFDVIEQLPLETWLEIWPSIIAEPIDAAVAAVALERRWIVASFDRKLMRRIASLGGSHW